MKACCFLLPACGYNVWPSAYTLNCDSNQLCYPYVAFAMEFQHSIRKVTKKETFHRPASKGSLTSIAFPSWTVIVTAVFKQSSLDLCSPRFISYAIF